MFLSRGAVTFRPSLFLENFIFPKRNWSTEQQPSLCYSMHTSHSDVLRCARPTNSTTFLDARSTKIHTNPFLHCSYFKVRFWAWEEATIKIATKQQRKTKNFGQTKEEKERQDFHRHASFHSLFFTASLHPSFLLTQTDLTTIRIQRGTTTRNRIAGTLLECYNLAWNTSIASCLLPEMIITHKKPSPKIKSKQNKTKLSSSSSSSYRVIPPSKQAAKN